MQYTYTKSRKNKRKRWYFKVWTKIVFYQRKIIEAFEKGIFPYIDGFQMEKESDEESTLENENIDTTDMPDKVKNLQQKEEINKGKVWKY